MIVLEKERDNDYCGAIGEYRNLFLSAMAPASTIRDRTTQQLKKQKLTVGLYHGKLNPLPSIWEFPKRLTMINLMNMWLMGNIKENTPPLHYITKHHIEHIKNGPNNLSKLRQVMKRVKYFGLEGNFWELGSWNGEGITQLWSTIWHRLDTYLSTEGNSNKMGCMEKSRKEQISWRTCYSNMQKKEII